MGNNFSTALGARSLYASNQQQLKELFDLIQTGTEPAELDLSNRDCYGPGFEEGCAALGYSTRVTSLNLSSNNLPYAAARPLVEALTCNETLAELRLACNNLGLPPSAFLASNPATLDPDTSPPSPDSPHEPSGAEILIDALANGVAPRLTRLSLFQNNINDSIRPVLVRFFNAACAAPVPTTPGEAPGVCRLVELNLAFNDISDPTVDAIASAAVELTSLCKVVVAGNPRVSKEAAARLAAAVGVNARARDAADRAAAEAAAAHSAALASRKVLRDAHRRVLVAERAELQREIDALQALLQRHTDEHAAAARGAAIERVAFRAQTSLSRAVATARRDLVARGAVAWRDALHTAPTPGGEGLRPWTGASPLASGRRALPRLGGTLSPPAYGAGVGGVPYIGGVDTLPPPALRGTALGANPATVDTDGVPLIRACWCRPVDATYDQGGMLHYHCTHEGKKDDYAMLQASSQQAGVRTL